MQNNFGWLVKLVEREHFWCLNAASYGMYIFSCSQQSQLASEINVNKYRSQDTCINLIRANNYVAYPKQRLSYVNEYKN